MVGMGYRQINADHIVFFHQYMEHTTLLVYFDNIITMVNDEGDNTQLKVELGEEFEVNVSLLRYFLGIDVARGAGFVLSQ